MSEPCARRILVVDDDRDVREALSEVLADLRYCPREAANGCEALRALEDGAEPCLILLDLMMPVMDGFEFRTRQAADAGWANIPVVVLSAHANVSQEAARLQAAAFLKKPVSLDELQAVVGQLCPAEPASAA